MEHAWRCAPPFSLTPFIDDICYRHYPDPITGKAQCGFVSSPADRIVGVHSLSDDVLLKRAGFPANFEGIEDKERYRERRFNYASPAPPEQPQRSQL